MSEIEEKLQRVRALLELNQLDAALLSRNPNFAWLTSGASAYINTATDMAAASLLVTPQGHFVLTNNIEATRLVAEERLEDLGFVVRAAGWHEAHPALEELTQGLRLGSDSPMPGAKDISGPMAELRLDLLPAEQERYRRVGASCAAAMDEAIRQVRPGMTEFQIAGLLAKSTYDRGVLPIVNLIATDDRIFRFRHPLPTTRQMEKYAMLVLCGRQYGLVASVTRLVYFGRLTDELRQKIQACALVDATFIANTRPGARLSDVFNAAQAAYAGAGYAEEWQYHHQGGPAGYEPRESVATPSATGQFVRAGQAYAWNPSIQGVKCEDTILVGPEANEVITEIRNWPALRVQVGDQVLMRPTILET